MGRGVWGLFHRHHTLRVCAPDPSTLLMGHGGTGPRFLASFHMFGNPVPLENGYEMGTITCGLPLRDHSASRSEPLPRLHGPQLQTVFPTL